MASRIDALIERMIVCSNVAAVSIDGDGVIGIVDVVGLDRPRDQLWLCCATGAHRRLHKRATADVSGPTAPMAAVDIVEAAAR